MVDRPDLDEFLGALNGFLNNKSTLPQSQDPTYSRFLEIFCRSVGSSEGHLLKLADGKILRSIISCGIPKEFESQFNKVSSSPTREPSPIDVAFRDQQVMAVVELKVGAGIPSWFLELMSDYKLKSLIAVPLIGQTRPVGVLCAYYRDVCLFDQGTLDRLMTIGRMVGNAMENSMAAGASAPDEATFSPVDAFMDQLTSQSLTKGHIFQSLTQSLAKFLNPSGLVCGPLHTAQSGLMMTFEDGTGVPPNVLSRHFMVPTFLTHQIIIGKGGKRQPSVAIDSWEAFRPIISGHAHATLCQSIVWDKHPQAAIVAWRADSNPFTELEELTTKRLAGIASLALRSL